MWSALTSAGYCSEMSERGERNLTFWCRALDERTRLMSELATPSMEQTIEQLIDKMTTAVTRDRKVLLFGNGGSAATAQHVAAELIGRFERIGRALPAIALTTDSSILTAVANDYGYDRVFERQIDGLARPGDVAIALSTEWSVEEHLARSSGCEAAKYHDCGAARQGRRARATAR